MFGKKKMRLSREKENIGKNSLSKKIFKKEEKIKTEDTNFEQQRTVIKKGYARKGDLVATLKHAVQGKDGKNVLGEVVYAEKVFEPMLVAGKNIKVEKGIYYYMDIDGVVEVTRDEKGINYIQGHLMRHGSFKVSISQDEMKAFLTVTPPIGGGEPVTLKHVMEECNNRGIVFGLKEQTIREVLQKTVGERVALNDVVIAEGEEPRDGEDGKVEFKVRLASGSRFRVLEDGSVDYKEQDLVTSVKENQLIAVVTRAQPGIKDGHTVKGESIKAKAGQEVGLDTGNNIRAEDKGETICYYSTIGGQLFKDRNRISVEPVLTINGDVGPETGNISFDGIVYIKGNVLDNYNVYAKKGVTITGNVGSSTVHSEGKVLIQNGVIGKYRGAVIAGDDISVKFVENSSLETAGSIYVQRAALNARLTAGKKIISKKEKGQIIGGTLKASQGIEVKILGNESEHKMEVYVGSDFSIESTLDEIRRKINHYQDVLKKIALLMGKLDRVSEKPENLPEKLKNIYLESRKKKVLIGVAIESLKKKEMECIQRMDRVFDAEVIVLESLYRGVKIFFGKVFYEPDRTRTNVRIYYDKEYEKIRVETR